MIEFKLKESGDENGVIRSNGKRLAYKHSKTKTLSHRFEMVWKEHEEGPYLELCPAVLYATHEGHRR